jgi:hypothetical protein
MCTDMLVFAVPAHPAVGMTAKNRAMNAVQAILIVHALMA